MYNTIEDIEREIAALEEDKEYLIIYWFEMGENDKSANLSPQHPNDYWYMMGHHDREYQIEIGFNPNPKPVIFEHF